MSGYLYSQTRTLEIDELGGLLRPLPFIGSALVMAMMAGCGLPGFANFAGEAMVLFGAWKVYKVVTVLACWGALIIGAVYMLRAIRNILHGPLAEKHAALTDAGWWRRVPFVLLLAALLIFGCFPGLLTRKIAPSVEALLKPGTKAVAAQTTAAPTAAPTPTLAVRAR